MFVTLVSVWLFLVRVPGMPVWKSHGSSVISYTIKAELPPKLNCPSCICCPMDISFNNLITIWYFLHKNVSLRKKGHCLSKSSFFSMNINWAPTHAGKMGSSSDWNRQKHVPWWSLHSTKERQIVHSGSKIYSVLEGNVCCGEKQSKNRECQSESGGMQPQFKHHPQHLKEHAAVNKYRFMG